jgi:hypothetical protein
VDVELHLKFLTMNFLSEIVVVGDRVVDDKVVAGHGQSPIHDPCP